MKIGTRVLYPDEVGINNAELIQISVYRGMQDNLSMMRDCANNCRENGIPFVIHPVGYSLLNKNLLDDLKEMAEVTDLALILHDERSSDGSRIEGKNEKLLNNAIQEIQNDSKVSFENATDTGDVKWFWNRFAESVTLDIGHIESSGLNSVEFVNSLDDNIIHKIQFVHLHRNNGFHGGITDHWPLTKVCRELQAFEELVKIKSDISVFLELNETEMIEDNLGILRELRERLVAD